MARQRSSITSAFVLYSVLRLAFFLVPLAVIYALSRNPILSAVIAAVIGFALSWILLPRQRASVAEQLQARTASRRRVSDEAVEDEAVDGVVEDDVAENGAAAGAGDQNDSAAASPRP